MRIIFTLFTIAFLSTNTFAQPKLKPAINWMSIDDAIQKSKTEPKKIFIEIYTDWCKVCKMMDKNTFTNKDIVAFINANFYPVRLDGESKETYEFKGKSYRYSGKGEYGRNDLAAYFVKGNMMFPSIVFLDENLETLDYIQEYLLPKDLDLYLQFYGTDIHKTESLKKYKKTFNSKIR